MATLFVLRRFLAVKKKWQHRFSFAGVGDVWIIIFRKLI